MRTVFYTGWLFSLGFLAFGAVNAQSKKAGKFSASVYAGIEVGSKGVKLSIVEIGKNAKSAGSFSVLKDSSTNTDFISFTESSFAATLDGLTGLFTTTKNEYNVAPGNIFTVISSGVKTQAAKENKTEWIHWLIDSFRTRINEPGRVVNITDVQEEARLSHLGIVPESRRYSTFLLDIGSGNTKGGFFPGTDTRNFKLFEINWGTKSVANLAEKRCEEEGDNKLPVYNKQLQRVLYAIENPEIIYAVNASGVYGLSDNIGISGGIAWAIATLLHPELLEFPVISVSYDDVERFSRKLNEKFNLLSPELLAASASGDEKDAIKKAATTVHKVFDQRSLMAGCGLLLKIMRQFSSTFETKQFYLIKNAQVGWISAYVDEEAAGN